MPETTNPAAPPQELTTEQLISRMSCNRTACQRPGARWFNTSTRAYYCRHCASDISGFTKRVEGFHICFPSTGDATRDAAMEFGSEYVASRAAHQSEGS